MKYHKLLQSQVSLHPDSQAVVRSSSPKPIKIKETVINRFFGSEQSRKEIEDTIVKALEFYFAQNGENPDKKIG